MGRLPTHFAGRVITMRVPYEMAGELVVAGNVSGTQFNDALFTNNVDMPFEAHRVIPRVTALDASASVLAVQPNQDMLQSLVRVRLNDFGKNVMMLKNPTLMNVLTKGTSERTWEFAEPYYLVRSEGFQVAIDTLTLPVWDGGQFPDPDEPEQLLTQIRIEWGFQGFLLVIAPASESR